MKVITLLSIFVLIPVIQIRSQGHVPDKKVLMTIAGRDVEAGEFIRMYRKSLDPGVKATPDKYIDQFVNFKLKVADAISKGYDTTRAFRDELNGYRKQLAQTYLTDQDIKAELLKKAYDRSLTEVNASHILVSCRLEAKPEDTLKAYSKAMSIRERIIAGEEFEKVAKETSDDKSAAINGGNLGYFTVFQMITPFENAAYSLRPGEVSMPVRTSFGYHIIRVNDRRPSMGKIKVAHIMKTLPPGSDEKHVLQAKQLMDSIYTMLKNGASFKSLAMKYSDHKQSAIHGGELDWFGAGEVIPEFSEAAFAIKDTGTFTTPFRSAYGYHIIKLLDRRPPASFEESKAYLESKINQADLAAIGKKSFVDKLRTQYKFSISGPAYKWFVNNTDSLILSGKKVYDSGKVPSGNIYSFADQHLSAREFASMLEKKGRLLKASTPNKYIDSAIEIFSSEQITDYEDANLERKYPDFRYLMNEFHDGILLFDISSEKIWNRVQQDSVGLNEFRLAHKDAIPDADRQQPGADTTTAINPQEDLISKYQDWLTDEWIRQLKEKFPVKINKKVLDEVNRRIE
jgi:peptidyl-prolyl cis-trans isomerase SurA